MRSNIGVAVASFIPGLGFILLGQVRRGVLFGAGFLALISMSLITPWPLIIQLSCMLAFLLWAGQIIFAVQTAQRMARFDHGLTSAPKPSLPHAPPPAGASRFEKIQHQARETVRNQLEPDEQLQHALMGHSSASLVSHVVIGPLEWLQSHQYYLGLTQKNLIFIERDPFGKPAEIRRAPMEQVNSVEMKSGRIQDQLILRLGGREQIKLTVNRAYRSETVAFEERLSARSDSNR